MTFDTVGWRMAWRWYLWLSLLLAGAGVTAAVALGAWVKLVGSLLAVAVALTWLSFDATWLENQRRRRRKS